MDFDDAKENIQPLACGRNVHMLHASLRTDAHELIEQRKRLEKEILDYTGDDPLEPWFHYIDWIEQSCPSGGKESGLQEVLVKCLTRFEKETQYYQDERMVKLYIKFISLLKEPLEKYEALYKAGIGTMVADFYIAWAYVADLCGNSRKADEIFLHGIRCNAQPKDVLEEAHQHFRFYVGQRLMYKDDEEVQDEANRELSERRLALASLRRRGKKAAVGSIRTGAALKSHVPGVVATQTNSTCNLASASRVYLDENNAANSIRPALDAENSSAVRMLIDAARNQENEREPGPWDKAHNKKHGKLFARTAKQTHLDFEIHEDSISEVKLPKVEIAAFKYPAHFVAKNKPQSAWVVPITTQEHAESSGLPEYNKCLIYPRPNKEFQLEELRLYYRYKRLSIANSFTAARDVYWSKGDVNATLRQYPNFAKTNLPQQLDDLDAYYQPSNLNGLKTCAKKLYNEELKQEFQLEEIMWQIRQERVMNTQYSDDAMEETMCANSERVKQRKSFFPAKEYRKSIYPIVDAKIDNLDTLLQDPIVEAEKKEKSLPFEIYEDTTQPKILVRASKHNDTPRFIAAQVDAENCDPAQFTFKAPLPPPPLQNNETPSEICAENAGKVTTSPVGYYDGEETCCTQQFNILLKSADKMSTPVTQKVATRVVKEVPEKKVEEMTSPETAAILPETSPQQYFKNLSTILETSEHGSSHTTAPSRTTTKSSCISNNELESTPAAPRLQSKLRVNEMLQLKEVNTQMEVMSIPENVGNFTRLEERDNTAQLCGLLNSVRFQEDKTETMTNKILIVAENKSSKFQEDKTETFSKLLKPAIGVFQEDKTDTFSKLLPPPMLPTEQTPMKLPPPIAMSNFGTPDLITCSPPNKKDAMLEIPNTPPVVTTTPTFKFRDSFVPESQTKKESNANDSFIPTIPQAVETNSFWKPDFGNLSMAERWSQNSPKTQEAETQKSAQNKHMLPDSFLKDFHMPPPVPMEHKISFANNASLKFLNETAAKSAAQQINQSTTKRDLLNFSNTSTLKFLDDEQKMQQQREEEDDDKESKSVPNNKMNFFEGNMETAQFNINNSMIKNSTCLVHNTEVAPINTQNYVMEQSVHIKQEPLDDKCDEMSIYYKKTPKTPKETRHAWINDSKTSNDSDYVHPIINLDATHQIIQTQCADLLLNPFSDELRNAFLDDIAFTEYIGTLGNCQLKRHVARLQAKQQIEIKNQKFEIIKLIGEGGFGSVYQGKLLPKGTKVALKQEQPPKLWEYYICLEIQSRIQVDDMLAAYMSVDWALIGRNSSILVNAYAAHGSLIQVCNKVKKITNKHLDEFVVMFIAREILEIIDHLHSVNIIHADIKPDNILFIDFLNYKKETRSMQLIDFGESIDMRLFQNSQQQFKYVYNSNELKCVEMREGRAWTYQLDLYGVCGVIHALLFGKYMEIECRSNGIWMPKIHMPRYFHKDLWENIFETLLNVKDCNTMPDLQTLRKEIKEVLVESENQVLQKLSEFNFNLRC